MSKDSRSLWGAALGGFLGLLAGALGGQELGRFAGIALMFCGVLIGCIAGYFAPEMPHLVRRAWQRARVSSVRLQSRCHVSWPKSVAIPSRSSLQQWWSRMQEKAEAAWSCFCRISEHTVVHLIFAGICLVVGFGPLYIWAHLNGVSLTGAGPSRSVVEVLLGAFGVVVLVIGLFVSMIGYICYAESDTCDNSPIDLVANRDDRIEELGYPLYFVRRIVALVQATLCFSVAVFGAVLIGLSVALPCGFAALALLGFPLCLLRGFMLLGMRKGVMPCMLVALVGTTVSLGWIRWSHALDLRLVALAMGNGVLCAMLMSLVQLATRALMRFKFCHSIDSARWWDERMKVVFDRVMLPVVAWLWKRTFDPVVKQLNPY